MHAHNLFLNSAQSAINQQQHNTPTEPAPPAGQGRTSKVTFYLIYVMCVLRDGVEIDGTGWRSRNLQSTVLA